jgi:transposase
VNTVRRHLALEAVPKYERKVKRQTKLGQFETYLRERLKAARPDSIPATRLAINVGSFISILKINLTPRWR